MLEALDRTLRDFVAARPELSVALIADEKASSLAVVAPRRFGRRVESLLAGACPLAEQSNLLIVRLALEEPAGAATMVCISVGAPAAAFESLWWPCRALQASPDHRGA